MKIGLIGGRGFVGSAFSRFISRSSFDLDIIEKDNYQDYIGNNYDILINANGNSKKYLATDNPEREFLESVNSIQKSLLDFSYSTYILCSTVDVYHNLTDINENHEDSIINPENISKYGLHKYLGELLVKNYSTRWLIFRFGGLIGPGLKKNPIYDLIHHIPLRVSINSSYQYINTDFAASAVFELLNQNISNRMFNLCGSGLICLNDVNSQLKNKRITYTSGNVPLETYHINTENVSKYIQIPTTKIVIGDYLESINK